MSTADQAKCPMCGRPVARSSGRGRPAVYCGDQHRREAEYRLRRVQSLINRAEKKAQDAGLAVVQASHYSRGRAEQVLAYWTDEVARLREELDALLAAQPGPRAVPDTG